MSELVQRRKAMAEEMMRDAICNAATAVLAETGFAALTMDRVAETAGVSKGTLYNYFQDKDALVQEVIEQAFAPIQQATDQAMAQPGSPRAKLSCILRLIVTGIEERRALGQAICTSELSPRLDAVLRAHQVSMRERFVENLRQAQAAGALRVAGGSPEQMGRFLNLVLNGVIEERMLHGDDCPTVEKDLSLIEDLVLRFWFVEECP